MSLEVAEIVAELKRSRAACAGDHAEAATTTMNLLVFTSSSEHRQWIVERACRLAKKHPSRLMIFDASRPAKALVVEASHESGVNCERIELGVGDVGAKELSSLAEALLQPDVPAVLWWTDKLLDDARFIALAHIADNVVVDSSGIDTTERSIANLAGALRALRGTAFRDLAWARLGSWREHISGFFDEPCFAAQLQQLCAITIACGSAAEPLYLAGWAGSRLGWKVCDAETFCYNDGREIKVDRRRAGDPRRIASITLRSPSHTFAIAAGDSWDTVKLSVVGEGGHEARPAPFQSPDNTTLFESAILARETDEIFEAALRTVGELLK